MDAAITKLLFIGAAIAVSAAVVAIMWTAISSNSPDTGDKDSGLAQITNQAVCTGAGGEWKNNECTPPSIVKNNNN